MISGFFLFTPSAKTKGPLPFWKLAFVHNNLLLGTDEAPHILLSELGRRVLEQEVPKISRYYPMVEVWRVAMMPDHIHLLLYVREPLPKGKHLGMVVRGFKTGCSRAWWQWQDEKGLGGETPSTAADGETPSTAAG